MKQKLLQTLHNKLSPQQIQLVRLVQLHTLELEERINKELAENPALETINHDYEDEKIKVYLSNSYSTLIKKFKNDIYKINLGGFSEDLLQQLHAFELSDKDYVIADFIIGHIDDDGYLRRDLYSLANDAVFVLGLEGNILNIEALLVNCIQKLYPVGVGSINLRECLLLQMQTRTCTVFLARRILLESFDLFSQKHLKKLKAYFRVEEIAIRQSLNYIENLNPKPGKNYTKHANAQIFPDFVLNISDCELSLNNRSTPELIISSSFKEMFNTYKTDAKILNQKNALCFIKKKLYSAKWFIDAISKRKNTLLLTMNAIIDYQKEYFLSGEENKIIPMRLKDIAKRINMDISTISRVINSKYIDTPYGLFLIKDFFSEGIFNNKGKEISSIQVKNRLSFLITKEDGVSPFTDERLSHLLKSQGYKVARRTITKYREQMQITVSRLRKNF